MAALGPLLFCGGSSLTGCASNTSNFQIGPSKGEVVGIAVGIVAVAVVGTVVLVEVHKAHHTMKGCVTSGPDGFELTSDGDRKLYILTGATAAVKAGDIVRVHGSKEKAEKNSSVPRDFMVEKINRDYGPCGAAPLPPPASH
jgi:hypothetical protein